MFRWWVTYDRTKIILYDFQNKTFYVWNSFVGSRENCVKACLLNSWCLFCRCYCLNVMFFQNKVMFISSISYNRTPHWIGYSTCKPPANQISLAVLLPFWLNIFAFPVQVLTYGNQRSLWKLIQLKQISFTSIIP